MKKLFRDIEIDAMSKNLLIYNLRCYAAKITGNKPKLADRLKDYVKREVEFPSKSDLDIDFEKESESLQQINPKWKVFFTNDCKPFNVFSFEVRSASQEYPSYSSY